MFSKKTVFGLTLLFSIIITVFAFANTKGLQFTTNKKVVNKGEKVCFVLKNNSNNEIVLPNSAPWVVISLSGRDKGKVVYSPIATLSLEKVLPNSEKKWCWNLKNFEGEYVHSGKYKVRLTVFINKKKEFLSTEIEVKVKIVKLNE